MSPTVMAELTAIKRQLTTYYAAAEDSSDDAQFDSEQRRIQKLMLLQDAGIKVGEHYDAVKVLRGVLPYRRWEEEIEREEEARMRAGGRTVCPVCGKRAVVHQTVCTYGYTGHPGADYSDYGKCENCGHEEL
jgi:hypothetical protein